MQPKIVKNFQDILQNLQENRKNFYVDIDNIKEELFDVFDLYLETQELIGKVASRDDKEVLIIETLGVGFRRIIGCFILLESGLLQESRMLLRNFLDYALISIDITYNAESFFEWEKTAADDLEKMSDHKSWYFKPVKIIERMNQNVSLYPVDEVTNAKNMYAEWNRISNDVLHAHSRTQINNIVKEEGIEIFGHKSVEEYKKIFNVYMNLLLAIIQQTIFIPKYRERVLKSIELNALSSNIAGKFSKHQVRLSNLQH
jgi:hypothetical protein